MRIQSPTFVLLLSGLVCSELAACDSAEVMVTTPFPEYQGAPTPWCPETRECVALHLQDLWGTSPPPQHLQHLCVQVDLSGPALYANAASLEIPVRRDPETGAPDLSTLTMWAVRSDDPLDVDSLCTGPPCTGAELVLRNVSSRVSRASADPEAMMVGAEENWSLSATLEEQDAVVRLSVIGQPAGAIRARIADRDYSCRIDATEMPSQCLLKAPACKDLTITAQADAGIGLFRNWLNGPADKCTIPTQPEMPTSLVIVPGQTKNGNGCSPDSIRALFDLRSPGLSIASRGRGTIRVRPQDGSKDLVLGPDPTSRTEPFPALSKVQISYLADANWDLTDVSGCDRIIDSSNCEVLIKESHAPVVVSFGLQKRQLSLSLANWPGWTLGGKVTGSGIDCTIDRNDSTSGTCQFIYPYGTNVILKAAPQTSGSMGRARWPGMVDCPDGQPICQVTIDRDKTVPIVFIP